MALDLSEDVPQGPVRSREEAFHLLRLRFSCLAVRANAPAQPSALVRFTVLPSLRKVMFAAAQK
jgi:hypothetical protein